MSKFFRLIVVAALGYAVYVLLFGTPDLQAPAKVEIPKGVGVGEIAAKLKEADIVRSKLGFEILVWLMRAGSKLQAGEYTFESKEMGLANIVRRLSRGFGASNEREITIIEGWTLDDVATYLEQQGIGMKREFFELVNTKCKIKNINCKSWEEWDFLKAKPAEVGLEGYLFPDTYRVSKGASPEEVVRKMLENFERQLTVEMRADIAAQGKTIFDLVRLASIVEAEVPHEQDRPVIAGILWKRLDAGMALQVDSTLNYATGGKNAALTRAELQIDSPYNTYKYRGLPPTPIGNPGLSALRAALYSRHSAYWYFLSSKDGQTHFGKNLEEHNQNKARYLK